MVVVRRSWLKAGMSAMEKQRVTQKKAGDNRRDRIPLTEAMIIIRGEVVVVGRAMREVADGQVSDGSKSFTGKVKRSSSHWSGITTKAKDEASSRVYNHNGANRTAAYPFSRRRRRWRWLKRRGGMRMCERERGEKNKKRLSCG